ncbi:succinyl-diaminopimelate desuccinylase [Pleionea sp. CnH1-48]|uniref:succinyl-diaminopimelate desuccinylase n=1 Tax=Pleionea sp. CnH1-48 TaxID=2954494 RepID=UPI002097C14A|nr:succinyl-diaminopimelate desuccinylase [Pleionea sp. CnH1-48]MCO7226818.1 succinyl-diaminopimelate desuccinylase [Pleionea sp. CnH1-48]
MHDSVIELTKALIERPSVTPEDCGCQQLMMDRLKAIGFDCEKMDFGDTENFWATRGNAEPVFVFAGHTDVVPPGNLEEWHTDPFEAVEKDGILYGRGAADMKGSLAAMITATESFIANHPDHKGCIGFLITSDEEGHFINGTIKVVEALMARNQPITYSLVGEPSSGQVLGDVVKNGRRGSLSGHLTVKGIQGHVAYPHLAKNAVHSSLAALSELAEQQWDQGNANFPPTSFQITRIETGAGAGNIVPGIVTLDFNFRYSTEQSADGLKAKVESILNAHKVDYELSWKLNGEPFLTPSGALLEASSQAIYEQLGIKTRAETTGGTSDGRFIAKTGAQVVELGPINATIHKVNECVSTQDLVALSKVYEQILEKLLL